MSFKLNPGIIFIFSMLLLLVFNNSCNKKCKSLASTNSGAIVAAYDFKDCYIYAKIDSTLVIATDSAFTVYKQSNFINCTPANLDAVDFSKHVILGYKLQVNACNVAFHRNVEIDTVKKEYHYSIALELCNGCGTALTGTNFVIAPKIPAGYTLKFSNSTRN